MKSFVAGVVAGVTLGGGALVAANLPNPEVGECDIADAVITRSDPTFIDPDGEVTGIRLWQVCGYQVPTGDGANVRAVDDEFHTDVDLEGVTPEEAEAAAAVLEGRP